MSATTVVYISCDHCMASPDGAEHTATLTRERARAAGWHTGLPGGRDVCPDCWDGGKR